MAEKLLWVAVAIGLYLIIHQMIFINFIKGY
jgi:hypothetical protein